MSWLLLQISPLPTGLSNTSKIIQLSIRHTKNLKKSRRPSDHQQTHSAHHTTRGGHRSRPSGPSGILRQIDALPYTQDLYTRAGGENARRITVWIENSQPRAVGKQARRWRARARNILAAGNVTRRALSGCSRARSAFYRRWINDGNLSELLLSFFFAQLCGTSVGV